jgi:hypothetical protein
MKLPGYKQLDPSLLALLETKSQFLRLRHGCARASAEAIIQATVNPGSLVRITCLTADEAYIVTTMLTEVLVCGERLDDVKTCEDLSPGHWPIVEMTNGSGIEIQIVKPGS